MPTFVLQLEAELNEELHADVGEAFVGFIIIEALHNILKVKRPGILDVLDQIEFPQDISDFDPENGLAEFVATEIDTSVEYLLEIQKEMDEAVYVYLPEEFYDFGSDYYEIIYNKLGMAITAIEENNQPSHLHALSEIFASPKFANGFSFKMVHYKDRVVVVVLPKGMVDSFGVINKNLADLLNGGDPEGNANYFYDDDVIEMSEENTMRQITNMLGGGH